MARESQSEANAQSINEGNDPAVLAGFTPHKALYNIKLTGKKSSSQVVNIAGQMMYEWDSGCDGWNSNHRFDMLYEYADTPATRITSDFSTYELFDNSALQFISQRKRDGELFEELRGSALMEAEGAGNASYRVPAELGFELPPGTLFPMRHTLAVLNAIHQKKKFFKATIFDGSDAEGPLEVNAFIGTEIKTAAEESVVKKKSVMDQSLLSGKSWKVRLAFFPLAQKEASADYEMSLVFHENGVISDMSVEYNDFSVSQKLVALEKKPQTNGCGQNNQPSSENE